MVEVRGGTEAAADRACRLCTNGEVRIDSLIHAPRGHREELLRVARFRGDQLLLGSLSLLLLRHVRVHVADVAACANAAADVMRGRTMTSELCAAILPSL